MIRTATVEDAGELAAIYNYYILNTTATFEKTAIHAEEMKARIAKVSAALPWIVYEEGRQITGYAYASEWKPRAGYKRTVETSVYLKHNATKTGMGSLLYKTLINRLIRMGFHTLIGGIALPNPASIALHEKFGYKKVAHFKAVGHKFNTWVDVGYWQLIIDEKTKQSP